MATINNYFSSRITISDIRNFIGAAPQLRIQRLNGLTINDALISTFPAQGDSSFSSPKYNITMNVDTNNDYTGAFYIQDPAITKTGVSVPPVGTLGYFAKNEIPDGWLEIGNEAQFFSYKRLIGEHANNQGIFADTEFTEIYKLLKGWNLIQSESLSVEGKIFNTKDPLKGYFIRCLNNSASGPDSGKSIFNTQSSYLSIHTHDGDTLFSGSTSGTVDRGYRSYLRETPSHTRILYSANPSYFGSNFWMNYKWQVSYGWDIEHSEGGGTIRITDSNYGSTPVKYAVNYDGHVHGRIKTYYRGYDGLYGKINPIFDEDIGTVYNPKYYRDTSFNPDSSPISVDDNSSFTNRMREEVTYYDPYTGTSALITLYTNWTHVTRPTKEYRTLSTNTAVPSAYATYRNTTHTDGSQIYDQFGNFIRNTNEVTNTFSNNTNYTEIKTKNTTRTTFWNTHVGRFVEGGPYYFTRSAPIDRRYYPYHILRSQDGTLDGDEFYNSGYDGAFADTTSAAGNHAHNYTFSKMHYRGHGETKPNNVALRICIKY